MPAVKPITWRAVSSAARHGFLLTLLEGSSRLLHVVKVETRRAGEGCQAVRETLPELPVSWVRSMVFDNGSEFANHTAIVEELAIPAYSAAPYSAYQRDRNERVNGLLLRHFPKGTSCKSLSKEEHPSLVERTDIRPRECLGY